MACQLNEFTNWLLFNCRAQFIIPSDRDRVVMRSLVVFEETCVISHTRLLQFSISQLLEHKRLEAFLEAKIPRLGVSFMHCASIVLDVVQRSQ